MKSVADRDVDLDSLNLDLDSEFLPNLNQDPGLCNNFEKKKIIIFLEETISVKKSCFLYFLENNGSNPKFTCVDPDLQSS